jgi:hypothetical protein
VNQDTSFAAIAITVTTVVTVITIATKRYILEIVIGVKDVS